MGRKSSVLNHGEARGKMLSNGNIRGMKNGIMETWKPVHSRITVSWGNIFQVRTF